MKRLMVLTFGLLLLTLGTGCSEKTSKLGPNGLPPGTPPPIDDDGGTQKFGSGATVELEILNSSQFDAFQGFADTMGYGTNDVRNLVINVDMEDVDPSSLDLYGGNLKTAWTDVTTTGSRDHLIDSFASRDEFSAQYNQWVVHGNDVYFKAFFEYTHGSLLFVAKVENDLNTLSGSVYWHQHRYEMCAFPNTWPWIGCGPPPITIPQDPVRHCWTVTLKGAVYDCRAYFVGNSVDMSSRIKPEGNLYQEIGVFENLDMTEAGIKPPNLF